MPRFAPFLLLLLLALPAWAEVASPSAAPDDPYTVTGVDVDVKGSSGVDARDKAFTEGGRGALKTLATRLSGVKDPDLKAVSDKNVAHLIKSFEVETEKASGARYIAKLTFHFRPEITEAFLDGRGLGTKASDGIAGIGAPPIEAQAASLKVIVLPIMRLTERNVLWEEKTAWARAWENYLSDNPNPNLYVPEGTMEDIATVSATEALAGLPGPLIKIMQRYQAKGVLVAVLAAPTLAPEPTQPLSVQLASFDAHGVLRNTSSFSLPAQPARKAMEWLQDGAAYATGLMRGQTEKVASELNSMNPGEAQRPVLRPAGTLQIAFTAPYANAGEWQRIRSSIQETPALIRLDIVSLTHAQANLQVTWRGTRAEFETALAEKGYRLEQRPGDKLVLVPSVISNAAPTGSPMPASYPAMPLPKDVTDQPTDSEGDSQENAEPPAPSAPAPAPNPPPPVTDVPPRIP